MLIWENILISSMNTFKFNRDKSNLYLRIKRRHSCTWSMCCTKQNTKLWNLLYKEYAGKLQDLSNSVLEYTVLMKNSRSKNEKNKIKNKFVQNKQKVGSWTRTFSTSKHLGSRRFTGKNGIGNMSESSFSENSSMSEIESLEDRASSKSIKSRNSTFYEKDGIN